MKFIYYSIWVDLIVASRKKNPNNKNWYIKVFSLITWFNALNLWTLFSWLKFCGIKMPLLSIDILKGTMINSFVCFALEYALPFAILNYFLIFYDDRFDVLIKKYQERKGKWALIYGLCSLGIAYITAILYKIFT